IERPQAAELPAAVAIDAGRGPSPSRPARSRVAVAPPAPIRAARAGSWSMPAARAVFLGVYLAAAAGLAAWWAFGQFVLWRLARPARGARGPVRELFLDLAGPDGARVALLESDRIRLPFTFTWARPVILLPSSLCDEDDSAALRYVLAH